MIHDKHLYIAIGQNAAARRRALGLTQEDVARSIGISRASLANMEVGRQRLLVHQLYGLAEALDLDGPEALLPRITVLERASETLPITGAELSESQLDQVTAFFARAS